MKLGFSSVCINPETEVELSGYGWFLERKATGVMDDIFAHALYLEQAPMPVLLIGCDLLALSPYIVNQVKSKLAEELSLTQEQIILSCIHTHTAPSAAQTIGCGEMSWDYVTFLIAKLIEAGKTAASVLHSVTGVRYGQTEIEPIGFNRARLDGSVGLLDSNVYVTCFDLEDEKPYLMVNYSCHPVILGPKKEISPDYPGDLIEVLKERGYHSIFLNGCCGDVDPVSNRDKWGSGTKEVIHKYALRLADGVEKALETAVSLDDSTLKAAAFTFTLESQELDWPAMDAAIKANYSSYDESSPIRRATAKWLELMKRKVFTQTNPYEETVYIQAFRIGKFVYIAAQGELFTQIGVDVRKALSDSYVIFNENANAAIRYVADDRDIDLGQYAGGLQSNLVYAQLPLKKGALEHFSRSISDGVKKLLPN
jgi:neutral ceramidase